MSAAPRRMAAACTPARQDLFLTCAEPPVIHDCRCGGSGVRAYGTFRMLDQAVIRGCTAESATQKVYGGVYVNSSNFEMSDQAKIEDCQAISTSSSYASLGGGVYGANNTLLTLSGSAVIQNCTAKNSADSSETYGGGVSASRMGQITLKDSARIAQCNTANGSGLYITGVPNDPSFGEFYADGGSSRRRRRAGKWQRSLYH